MKKWTLGIVGTIVLIAVAILGIGTMVPESHVASRVAGYDQPPEAIWEAITNFEEFPSWRSTVDSVEPLVLPDGRTGWVENGSFGPLPMALEEATPPRRLVLRIADPELPFGGTWTYEVRASNGGSTLTITETGQISSAFFRFMSRFVFGYTATMEAYLIDLGNKFGQQVTPQPAGG